MSTTHDGEVENQVAIDEPAPQFMVGIGASAGGLEALERFFQALPLDTGMAFVVIQHLSPNFKSLMDELLARFTKIPIVRLDEPVVPRRNHIYLLAPRKELVLVGGQLHSYDKPVDQRLSMPINTFFRSLARDAGERGIAIVLSGTGSDGSLGLCDVHDAGGLVLVQSDDTAKFDGMTRSAVATGQVDAVMAPEDMPKALMAYAKSPSIPVISSPAIVQPPPGIPAVLDRLRDRYGIDFHHYKPATISRRIDRRVTMGQASSVQEYCAKILNDPDELNALYKDLLIGVTRFFRDPEAFTILESVVIPQIIDSTPHGEEIRVWTPACATGEEPYSLAILFIEAFEARGREPALKIFASDVHRDSIQFAAEGRYTETSLTELTAARRERFFDHETGQGSRVTAQLRRHILFSHQNVIRDPPFTRMDLVSCRNMLIYLQPPAQLKALAAFHFALKQRGILFLGPSENVGDLQNEFEAIERQWKIYRKIKDTKLPMELRVDLVPSPVRTWTSPGSHNDVRLGRIYDQILRRFVPSAVLVDSHHNVLHVFGEAERYLRLPPGRMTTDLLSMTRGDLRVALASAVQNVAKKNDSVVFRGVRFSEYDSDVLLDIVAEPLSEPGSANSCILIRFETQANVPMAQQSAGATDRVLDIAAEARERIHQLEGELQHTKESLQTTVEELETSNEELQASNEELLAANEELQSTNEELHSVNEELYSVNAEHEQKIKDLNRVSSDLKNLIQATEIGTIFLDADQRVRFFTPAAARVFHLMTQDIDRDLRHITSRVKEDVLFDDIAQVRATLNSVEKRIQTIDGRVYLRRIMPYFEVTRAPSGFVLTFIDITALSNAEEALRHINTELESRVKELDAANHMHKLIFDSAPDGILTVNSEGIVQMFNAQAEKMFGYAASEIIGQNIDVLVPSGARARHARHRAGFLDQPDRRQMGQTRWVEGRRKNGTPIAVQVTLTPLAMNDSMQVMAFVTDMTRTQQLENERDQIVQKMTEAQKLESLGILAGGIAHDFNNLLTGIMATAGLLVDGDVADSDLRESARIILESTHRAAELCQQLLAYSGRSKFVLRAKNVTDLVATSSKLALSSSVRKNAQISFDLTPSLPLVMMDETQIRQVVMNLILNASEAVDPNGGQISVRTGTARVTPSVLRTAIISESAQEGEYVFIEVADNGCGIRPEDLRRIFEPFYTTKFTGRGLGLSAVLGIVRGHHGVMCVNSEIGKGTKFTVYLPIAEESTSAFADPPPTQDTWKSSGCVLVADDELSIRNVCRRLLVRLGFEVDVVEDGQEALERFNENPGKYAIVLLDLTMPRTDGIAAFQQMKRIRSDCPIILMSGFSPDDASVNLETQLKHNGFLPKPFDGNALTTAVRKALEPAN